MIERKMRSCEKARPLHCSKRSMKYFSAGDKSPENESASNLSPSNVSPSNVSPGNVLPANVPPMRSNSLNDCLPKTTLKATSKVSVTDVNFLDFQKYYYEFYAIWLFYKFTHVLVIRSLQQPNLWVKFK